MHLFCNSDGSVDLCELNAWKATWAFTRFPVLLLPTQPHFGCCAFHCLCLFLFWLLAPVAVYSPTLNELSVSSSWLHCFLRNVCGFIATSPSETWSNYINLLNIIWITLSLHWCMLCFTPNSTDSKQTFPQTEELSQMAISAPQLPAAPSESCLGSTAMENSRITRMLMKSQPGRGWTGNHLWQLKMSFHL